MLTKSKKMNLQKKDKVCHLHQQVTCSQVSNFCKAMVYLSLIKSSFCLMEVMNGYIYLYFKCSEKEIPRVPCGE